MSLRLLILAFHFKAISAILAARREKYLQSKSMKYMRAVHQWLAFISISTGHCRLIHANFRNFFAALLFWRRKYEMPRFSPSSKRHARHGHHHHGAENHHHKYRAMSNNNSGMRRKPPANEEMTDCNYFSSSIIFLGITRSSEHFRKRWPSVMPSSSSR